jgi:hypothetical protein
MKIKHPVIKLVIAIIIVAGALIYFYRDRFACDVKSSFQQGVCKALGGELASKTVGIGFAESYKYGCFTKKKTSDAGKECTSDWQCQGYCVWLNGDIVGDIGIQGFRQIKTCSDFGKALPVCAIN